MINLIMKMINLLITNWKGVISEEKKEEQFVLVTRTCPPGLALAGPDMTEVRLLV